MAPAPRNPICEQFLLAKKTTNYAKLCAAVRIEQCPEDFSTPRLGKRDPYLLSTKIPPVVHAATRLDCSLDISLESICVRTASAFVFSLWQEWHRLWRFAGSRSAPPALIGMM